MLTSPGVKSTSVTLWTMLVFSFGVGLARFVSEQWYGTVVVCVVVYLWLLTLAIIDAISDAVRALRPPPTPGEATHFDMKLGDTEEGSAR